MRTKFVHIFCLYLVLFSLPATSAFAWDYNLSRILNPLNNWHNTSLPWCPPVGSSYKVCKQDDPNTPENEEIKAGEVSHAPVNDSGYKYSCYYQAFSFVKDAPNPMQPLTTDLNVIRKAIGGDGVSNPVYDARSGITEEKLKQIINVGRRPIASNVWPLNYYVNAGANTSAMQGLLWSWRSVSKNWEGVWTSKSDYEDSGDSSAARNSLPSPANSKHIIIISDGNDSDGVQNYEFRNYKGDFNDGQFDGDFKELVADAPIYINQYQTTGTPGLPTYYISKGIYNYEGDYGFTYKRHTEGSKKGDITSPFDICDAHMPQDSIPLRNGAGVAEDSSYAKGLPYGINQEGYEEVCTAMKAQGIKVHSILYGYAGNDKLTKCSEITGGYTFDNVPPDELEEKLKEIFLFAAKAKIRLVK